MEPRPNLPQTLQANREAPTRPESLLKSRFSIELLEERIAPDKGGIHPHKSYGGSADPLTSYGL